MRPVHTELKKQKASNRASLSHFADFESHRNQQTDLILTTAPAQSGRLCVLGAGNCFDLNLNQIASKFQEVHLVDIDRAALVGARSRLPKNLAKKIHIHSPVDISCANNKLEAWRDMRVTPEALIDFPSEATKVLMEKLPGPFDCVVSTCLLSQLLLTYRKILGENHVLFNAGLMTLIIAHFRSLVSLTAASGNCIFVTDISKNTIAPLSDFSPDQNGIPFLLARSAANQIFNYLEPGFLKGLIQQDPFIASNAVLSEPLKSWLWQNGPRDTFLVYACHLLMSKPALSEPA